MYRVGEFLTPEERLDAMRLGGLKKLASYGLKPSDMDGVVKSAGVSDKLGLLGSVMRTSVMIGVPVGALWYALSSGLKDDSEKTRKMKATLDHYNEAVTDNKNRLQNIYPGV